MVVYGYCNFCITIVEVSKVTKGIIFIRNSRFVFRHVRRSICYCGSISIIKTSVTIKSIRRSRNSFVCIVVSGYCNFCITIVKLSKANNVINHSCIFLCINSITLIKVSECVISNHNCCIYSIFIGRCFLIIEVSKITELILWSNHISCYDLCRIGLCNISRIIYYQRSSIQLNWDCFYCETSPSWDW